MDIDFAFRIGCAPTEREKLIFFLPILGSSGAAYMRQFEKERNMLLFSTNIGLHESHWRDGI
jgi:hypothetical protein